MIILSRLDKEKLKDQILRGKKWIATHAQQTGTDNDLEGNPYNDEDWQKKLLLYEMMVDEWQLRDLPVAEIMNDDEIIENEKKRREELKEILEGPGRNSPVHSSVWKIWFGLREEGQRRKIYPQFIPTRLDPN